MIPVSVEYESAIDATVRKTVAKIEVTWTDPDIDPTISASANDENRINYPDQTGDLIESMSRKWAHLDGTLKPNGTFYPCPTQTQADAGAQMGWWGATRCNGTGVWASPITLTMTFAARPIVALVVVGDSQYNEYPVDFLVKIYNASNTLIHTSTITGNTELKWLQSISSENIADATYMKLIISKWSAPNRVAKIAEFYTAVVETYEGDEIVSMNLLEEREISDGSLPVGNISANELDFSLQNIAIVREGETIIDPFFPSNPNSTYQNVVKKNRRVRAWIGLVLPDDSVEYIALGTFWTGDWTEAEQDSVVSTSARDRMELLRNAVCSTMPVYQNLTMYELAEYLLQNAKTNIPMPDLKWEIDLSLHNFSVPYGYFDRQDYFKCIKDLVTACSGQAYMSRNDVLIITGPGNY